MEVVRLTNLGNLTLKNLMELEKKYEENAPAKRAKLAKLWDSEEAMGAFQKHFSFYHADTNILVTREDDSYALKNVGWGDSTHLNPEVSELMDSFEQMGLVRVASEDKPLEDILADRKRDEYANPVKYVKSVTVELTGLCNLQCGHCYRGGSREGEEGLPADEIKKALEPLLRAGIKKIGFTGGEPTLRKDDLLDIIEYASQFMELNGVSIEEKLEHEYGTPNPTVEDVLKTETYISLRARLMNQLSWAEEDLKCGDWRIFDKHTEEDVKRLLRDQAKYSLEFAQEPSNYNLDGISILSNAFFANQRELIRKLKSYGNVSMQTSLDSNDEATTDRNRGRKGVFAKVRSLIEISKEEGLKLSLQGHNLNGEQSRRDDYEGIHMFSVDGMLQLGNAVQGDYETRDGMSSTNHIGDLSSANRHGDGWCKGFTRPDDLHIRPTGNVGNCLYAYAVPEEFGNLGAISMTEIVNGIQETKVYQMFKDGRIEQYQHELDTSLFPESFSKSCEPVILTLTYGMIKERLLGKGLKNLLKDIDKNDEDYSYLQSIQRIRRQQKREELINTINYENREGQNTNDYLSSMSKSEIEKINKKIYSIAAQNNIEFSHQGDVDTDKLFRDVVSKRANQEVAKMYKFVE